VPADVVVHLAVGTSLTTIVATSLSSVWAHHRHGAVNWPLFGRFSLGLLPGGLLGGLLAGELPGLWLHYLVAAFVLMVALQILIGGRPPPQRELPGPGATAGAGLSIGLVSAMVGIGGGPLTVPWLLWHNVPMRAAVATSAACGAPIALTGALAFIITGWGAPGLPDYSSGFVYWPAVAGIVAASLPAAPVGAWLAHRLPVGLLRRLFGVFLLLVGVKMLMT
jgi:uncharacterized membrane protein YfcA